MRPPSLLKRSYVTERLSAALDKGRNAALLGPPKSGKSLVLELLKHSLKTKTVFFSLKQSPMTPEFFTLSSLNAIARSYDSTLENPELDIETMKKSAEKNCNELLPFIDSLENELQKIKPDQKKMVELVRDSLITLNKKSKITLIIDDADELLQLENFPGIGGIWSMLLTADSPHTIISSSHIVDITSKLSETFDMISMPALDDKEKSELAGTRKSIILISDGHPYVLNRLALTKTEDELLIELLSPDSALFQFMSGWVDDALSRARGATLPKAILQVLARDGPMRLSDIARKIFRPAPVTKSLLERLLSTDIIIHDDKNFSFSSKALERWYRVISSLPEMKEMPSEKAKKELIKIMEGGA